MKEALAHYRHWQAGAAYSVGVVLWIAGGLLLSSVTAMGLATAIWLLGIANLGETELVVLTGLCALYLLPVTADGWARIWREAINEARISPEASADLANGSVGNE